MPRSQDGETPAAGSSGLRPTEVFLRSRRTAPSHRTGCGSHTRTGVGPEPSKVGRGRDVRPHSEHCITSPETPQSQALRLGHLRSSSARRHHSYSKHDFRTAATKNTF